MIEKVFEYLAKGLTVFASIVTMVECTGEAGETKKEIAKADIKKALTELQAEGKVPAWLVSILTNDFVLGLVIDTIVGYANEQKWFEKSYEILKGAE
ncbi:hypothetical protein [Sporomusa acidovorans]|uniref:Uncharacterized protein n=1 Tax=Sporomusa acidovorans (strain ATCC 49682 / DSM 3132 / Mol) TaxID=1123286 RepID=A0ABZ3J758_SPOA4|nr:hypothetical protein [Sporomusa acidovorans]OZC23804.1 hypothetical protein SPACI_04290 [Sporomusa acidovorans DSM 3132]SDF61680.1 hypothetical protein SAMN04488499_10639 [Sporomusa acidovorans]